MADRSPAKRNALIDALRFFAIALVVLTHLLSLHPEFGQLAPWLLGAITSFNMPLFALVSGYVLWGREGDSPLRFLRGKALGLLVPYLAWISVEVVLTRVAPVAWVPRLLSALADPRAGFQMWFLWVLFVMFAIFTVGRLVSRSSVWTAALALAVGALAFLPLSLASPVAKIGWLYPFFVLGYLAAKHRESLRRWDLAIAIAGLVAFPALLLAGPWGAGVRFLPGLAGTVAAWAVYRVVPKVAIRAQAWLGRRTLGIYGGQMVLFGFLVFGTGWVGLLGSWFAVTGGATLLTLVLERTALTRAVFLGQWPKAWR